MSSPPPPLPTEQAADESKTTSPLHAAMKMADLVRAGLNKSSRSTTQDPSDEKADFRLTPGLLEGVVAGASTLVVLTPVRSLVLRAAGNKLGMLPDLIFTTSQIMIASNAGLYFGSLYGSYHYLQTFSKIPVHAVSSTVDGICRQSQDEFGSFYADLVASKRDEKNNHSTWNPNASVLAEFLRAMELCRDRQQSTAPEDKNQTSRETTITWWK